jgi:hypothetical protein
LVLSHTLRVAYVFGSFLEEEEEEEEFVDNQTQRDIESVVQESISRAFYI